MLRAAEAEAQAEAARAMVGADMGPNVNSATSPVHGARNRKGYKIRNLDLFSQVEGLKSTNIAHAHSMVKKTASSLLQFVPFASSLKNGRESMGSNLGHRFRGGAGRFRELQWVTICS